MPGPPANQAADSHEIRPLTGIRGVAALMVVLFHNYHAWTLLLPALRHCEAFAVRGNIGVDLFFILSGFILSYVYNVGEGEWSPAGYRRFLWFRLARIYPSHLATLAVLFVMVMAAHYRGIGLTGNYSLSSLPFQLTMTQSWPWAYGGWDNWNYPSWSISAEWFAYLGMFPVVWWLHRLKPGPTVSLIVGYAVLAFWLFVVSPRLPWHPLWRVSCEFVAGGMLFGTYRAKGFVTRACQRCATVIAAVVLGLLWFYPIDDRYAEEIVILLFPALLLGLTAETSLVSRLLATAPALWLGRVSYAIYMSHAIIEKFVKIALPSERYAPASLSVRLLVFGANVVGIMLSAVALCYLVEIPARNFLRRVSIWWTHRRTKLPVYAETTA